MAIKEHNVHLISQLAKAASDLSLVTNSDTATNAILSRIEELAAGEVTKTNGGGRSVINEEVSARSETVSGFNIEGNGTVRVNTQSSDTNQAEAPRPAPGRAEPKTALEKWGDFANLASNPKTTIAELRAVVLDLGYTGLGISVV